MLRKDLYATHALAANPYGAWICEEHGRGDMNPGSPVLRGGGQPPSSRAHRRVLAACLVLAALCLAASSMSLARRKTRPPSHGELMLLDLPDLYQMAVESDSTVLATVKQLTRFAVLEVEEIYGGRFRAPELRVMYQAKSWERRLDGQSSIRFRPGERYLLFLRYHRAHEEVVAADLFELMDADWGRVKLEPEGGTLYIEAMRLLMGAATRPEMEQRQAVLVGLLASPNHLAAASAMGQAYRRRLGSAEQIPVLLAQMDRGIAGLQLGALKILQRLAPTLPDNLDGGALAESIHRRIGWNGRDPAALRKHAVKTLLAIGPAAIPKLKQVAREDVDQNVRYAAAVALLSLERP